MIETWDKIKLLIAEGNIKISEHGYDELAADDLNVREIVAGTPNGSIIPNWKASPNSRDYTIMVETIKLESIIEEYPEYPKGPCVLILLRDKKGYPVHAVWGVPFGTGSPAVLVTAYRPDPERWEDDFIRRKK